MAIRLPRIVSSRKVPKGYFAVYVGENQKRFVIPVSYLNQPLFQDLLGMSEDEFGYSHPTGGLRIPCNEDIFVDATSRLNRSGNNMYLHVGLLDVIPQRQTGVFPHTMEVMTSRHQWPPIRQPTGSENP
ncbi:hypothetical protein V6N12_060741 [Hibiscus sabdariffa]|uniref:Uncharacterized protein n=1 Tax=Hibiscus sabdariffa TaxID=183260 RepID=A0ABR2D5D4_9ROSI